MGSGLCVSKQNAHLCNASAETQSNDVKNSYQTRIGIVPEMRTCKIAGCKSKLTCDKNSDKPKSNSFARCGRGMSLQQRYWSSLRSPCTYLRATAVQNSHCGPDISQDLYPLKVSWILFRDEVQQSLTMEHIYQSISLTL